MAMEVEVMQPTLCTRCKKRVAVVFISKIEKGETVNEGLCLKCAKEIGLPQVGEMMRRMGITDDDLDAIKVRTGEPLRNLGVDTDGVPCPGTQNRNS